MKLLRRSTIAVAGVAGTLLLGAAPALAIVGGQEATRSYPGMTAVSVDYPGLGILKCGGSLITPRYLLTAAHCVSDFTVEPSVVPVAPERITVRINSLNRLSGGREAVGARVLIHPDWAWLQDTGQPIADIALVKLDRAVAGPMMPLSWARSARSGPSRLIGWGLPEFPVPAGTELPEMLRQRDVTVLPAADCSGGLISAGEICTSPGACFGDSGGPALQWLSLTDRRGWQGKSVGIAGRETNAGDPCGSPVIYTDPAFYARWIVTTIVSGTVAPSKHVRAYAAQATTPADDFTFFMKPTP